MRVVVVNDFAHINGGAASVAIESATGLARRGHEVTFFAAVGPVERALTDSGVEVICTGQHEILTDPSRLRAVRQGIWNREAAKAFALLLSQSKREDTIVHLHGWSKALSSSVVRVVVDRGFKVVCTLHDYFVACPNGGLFDYQLARQCHLRPLSLACAVRNCDVRSYQHKLWRVARQVVQETLGRLPQGIDNFIVLSRLSRDVLLPHLPKEARLFEVSNPINVPRQLPLEPERRREFMMVGRLSPEKGGVLFARAARQCGVSACFVGDGESRSEIASTCPSADITGWVPKTEVAASLARARAVVFPSLWYEAQALVPLEAAAFGVPTIVSDGCAGAESVEDGVTGLFFKNGDIKSLSAALCRMSDDAFVGRLGHAAYERYWASPLTPERHVACLEQVYGTVLGGCA